MSINKLIGAIEIPKGNCARVRVLSFKRSGEYQTDPEEIRKTFPPEGFVFAHGIRDYFDDNSLVEIFAIENYNQSNSTDDQFVMDKSRGHSSVGYEVFQITNAVLVNGAFIDLDLVTEYVSGTKSNTTFYLLLNEYIYGPFKKTEENLIPPKEVNKISVDQSEFFKTGERTFLLKKPQGDVKIDCMTMIQLTDWLKERIRSLSIGADYSMLRRALETQTYAGLDRVRMHRALDLLDQLGLSIEDLKGLCKTSEKIEKIYEDALTKVNSQFILPLQTEIQQLEREILDLKDQKLRTEKLISERKKIEESTRADLKVIEQEKERIIMDIRIHSLVNINSEKMVTPLVKYDEQVYYSLKDPYSSVPAFISVFNESINTDNKELNRFVSQSVIQMKDYKCILCDSVEPLLQFGRLSNNCRILLQQVEVDWLKFEALLYNGLKYAWEVAYNNPEMIHFLILQDLNMASIECYAKPLNDLIAGLRSGLPGLLSPLPENLWIFGVPLPSNLSDNFGLPLNRCSYDFWGAFPRSPEKWMFKEVKSSLFLNPNILNNHDLIGTPYFDDYFQE